MLNFDKKRTINLLDITAELINAEIKSSMKNKLVGMMYKNKLDSIHNILCTIFEITDPDDKLELKTEMDKYWEDMNALSNKHIKDVMNDDWSWI